MSVPVQTGDTFDFGGAVETGISAHSLGVDEPSVSRQYDISRDGKRFLMIKPLETVERTAPEIVLVQNWVEELKRLVPPEN